MSHAGKGRDSCSIAVWSPLIDSEVREDARGMTDSAVARALLGLAVNHYLLDEGSE